MSSFNLHTRPRTHSPSRRALALVTVAASAALFAAPAAVAHEGDTSSPSPTRGHTAKLDRLRAVTAPYAAGPAAPWTAKVADLAGITCIEDPQGRGTMGVHFADVGNLTDGQVDELAPEALIYEPNASGEHTLVGVEYLVLADAWDAAHAHAPILFGQTFARVAAGNRYGLPDFYELHVWHERANPLGLFNDWNPDVHCE